MDKFTFNYKIPNDWKENKKIYSNIIFEKDKPAIQFFISVEFSSDAVTSLKLYKLPLNPAKATVRLFHGKISTSNQSCVKENFFNYWQFDVDCNFYKLPTSTISQCDCFDDGREVIGINTINTISEESKSNKLDNLTINFEVIWYGFIDNLIIKSPSRLENLFMNSEFNDVIIKIGEEKLPAHKLILIASSPVFEAMFTSKMVESIKNEIEIEDIEVDVMKAVLKFLYTDKITVGYKIIMKMLYVVEKYQITKLKKAVEKALITNINHDNILEILFCAQKHKLFAAFAVASEYFTYFTKEICAKQEEKESSTSDEVTR